jgi:DNA-directed RNA polymerase subunit RPC12/RpoP
MEEAKVYKTNLNQQYDVVRTMQNDGYNVCTCGSCGGVVLFDEEMMEAETIECPLCGDLLDYADYPDLYYEGMKETRKNKI